MKAFLQDIQAAPRSSEGAVFSERDSAGATLSLSSAATRKKSQNSSGELLIFLNGKNIFLHLSGVG